MAVYPRLLKWQLFRGFQASTRSSFSQIQYENVDVKQTPVDILKELNEQIREYKGNDSFTILSNSLRETGKYLSCQQHSQGTKQSRRSRSLDKHVACRSLTPLEWHWGSSPLLTYNNGDAPHAMSVVKVNDAEVDIITETIVIPPKMPKEESVNVFSHEIEERRIQRCSSRDNNVAVLDQSNVTIRCFTDNDVICSERVDVTILHDCTSNNVHQVLQSNVVSFTADFGYLSHVSHLESLSNKTTLDNHISDRCRHMVVLTQESPSESKGNEKKQIPEKPTIDQLNKVKGYAEHFIPRFFVEKHEHSVCVKDIIFENNCVKKPFITVGIEPYVSWMIKTRIWAHLKYANVRVKVLNCYLDEEEGTITVRWQMSGIPNSKAFMFWKFLPINFRKTMDSESEYRDGVSTLYIEPKKGRIQKHKMDMVIENKVQDEVTKVNPVLAKLALMIGIAPESSMTLCDLLYQAMTKRVGLFQK